MTAPRGKPFTPRSAGSSSQPKPQAFYDHLVGRHIESRLYAFPVSLVTKVLDRAGILLADGKVRLLSGASLDASAARRYKQAVLHYLGAGAYEMTRVHFRLAGCDCADCTPVCQDD